MLIECWIISITGGENVNFGTQPRPLDCEFFILCVLFFSQIECSLPPLTVNLKRQKAQEICIVFSELSCRSSCKSFSCLKWDLCTLLLVWGKIYIYGYVPTCHNYKVVKLLRRANWRIRGINYKRLHHLTFIDHLSRASVGKNDLVPQLAMIYITQAFCFSGYLHLFTFFCLTGNTLYIFICLLAFAYFSIHLFSPSF